MGRDGVRQHGLGSLICREKFCLWDRKFNFFEEMLRIICARSAQLSFCKCACGTGRKAFISSSADFIS